MRLSGYSTRQPVGSARRTLRETVHIRHHRSIQAQARQHPTNQPAWHDQVVDGLQLHIVALRFGQVSKPPKLSHMHHVHPLHASRGDACQPGGGSAAPARGRSLTLWFVRSLSTGRRKSCVHTSLHTNLTTESGSAKRSRSLLHLRSAQPAHHDPFTGCNAARRPERTSLQSDSLPQIQSAPTCGMHCRTLHCRADADEAGQALSLGCGCGRATRATHHARDHFLIQCLHQVLSHLLRLRISRGHGGCWDAQQ